MINEKGTTCHDCIIRSETECLQRQGKRSYPISRASEVFAREASVANRESLERIFASRTYYQDVSRSFRSGFNKITKIVRAL